MVIRSSKPLPPHLQQHLGAPDDDDKLEKHGRRQRVHKPSLWRRVVGLLGWCIGAVGIVVAVRTFQVEPPVHAAEHPLPALAEALPAHFRGVQDALAGDLAQAIRFQTITVESDAGGLKAGGSPTSPNVVAAPAFEALHAWFQETYPLLHTHLKRTVFAGHRYNCGGAVCVRRFALFTKLASFTDAPEPSR